jgi:peptidoglycan/xylan/chitin deacetylase (PgdA/CDA1 family)
MAPPPQFAPLICLGFHAIDVVSSDISLRPDRFAVLMQRLRDDGFWGVSVREWESGAIVPGRPVIITFDDGFRSVHSEALPILAEYGFHATVFVISSAIGKRTDWHTARGRLPGMAMMSEADLRELLSVGWEIGSHGVQHVFLPALDDDALDKEVRVSRDALEAVSGEAVTTFAYPYGASSPNAVRAVREAGYRTAWTTRPGRVSAAQPLLQCRHVVPPRATEVTLRAMFGSTLTTVHAALAVLDRVRGRRPRYSPYDERTDCSGFTAEPVASQGDLSAT